MKAELALERRERGFQESNVIYTLKKHNLEVADCMRK